jgi:hypothetical protein
MRMTGSVTVASPTRLYPHYRSSVRTSGENLTLQPPFLRRKEEPEGGLTPLCLLFSGQVQSVCAEGNKVASRKRQRRTTPANADPVPRFVWSTGFRCWPSLTLPALSPTREPCLFSQGFLSCGPQVRDGSGVRTQPGRSPESPLRTAASVGSLASVA